MKSMPALIPGVMEVLNTPLIINYSLINKGLITVKGNKNSTNISLRFNELSHFINSYFQSNSSLDIVLCFDYFNMLTTKHLLKLIQQLNKYQRQGKSIEINWQCACSSNEVEMLDMGLDFALMADFRFFITIK